MQQINKSAELAIIETGCKNVFSTLERVRD